jgi:hypothetical protein
MVVSLGRIALLGCILSMFVAATPTPVTGTCTGNAVFDGSTWGYNCSGTCETCGHYQVARWTYCACDTQGGGNDSPCISATQAMGSPPTVSAVCLQQATCQANCFGGMGGGEPPNPYLCNCW